jgi:GMP synthase-like glutamine amidotransferase
LLRRELVRIHVLQHVPFEGLGSIERWAAGRRAEITWTRFYESALASQLPNLAEVDLLIALGGPMSVNDEEELPWLRSEKHFIAQAIREEKAVLGICLGAQLIASSLGARVYPGSEKEIGWFPVFVRRPTPQSSVGDLGFSFPEETTVFHWHGETFDLPPGATHLASNSVTRNQAFRIGSRVIGLQFHLETTPESAAALLDHCGSELIPGGTYIESPQEIRDAPPHRYARIHALMTEILEAIVG